MKIRNKAYLDRLFPATIDYENVKIFSAQPPPRIDSFQTKRSLPEKKRFLSQVGKQLYIRHLSIFRFLGIFSFLSGCRPYYG